MEEFLWFTVSFSIPQHLQLKKSFYLHALFPTSLRRKIKGDIEKEEFFPVITQYTKQICTPEKVIHLSQVAELYIQCNSPLSFNY